MPTTVGEPPKDFTKDEADVVIERVAATKEEWGSLHLGKKIVLLQQIQVNLAKEAENWVAASCVGHKYNIEDTKSQGHLIAEVWTKGPCMVGQWVNSLIEAYKVEEKTGKPPQPLHVTEYYDGSKGAQTFPWGVKETLWAAGIRTEVIIEGGGEIEQNQLPDPQVIGILGAGNYEGPNDILHFMFVENNVAIYKPNPVNHHATTVIQRVFAPLIDAGYLGYVCGGLDVGQCLVQHKKVDRLVITGSARSYDRILWGNTEEEQKKNKADDTPIIKKELIGELGSVNPYIICPGVWSESEIDAHAQQLASVKMINNGHICASPQVVVTSKNWPQREEFLAKVQHYLEAYPGTNAYYPHCDKSYENHQKAAPDAVVCKNPKLFEGQQHPLFIPNASKDAYVTQNEAFCPVLSEVALDIDADPEVFLPAAVEYANTSLWGSLTCTVIIHKKILSAKKDLVKKTVADLKFGAIGINQAAVFAVLFPPISWGAYPRHTTKDIQSGMGKIGNCWRFKNNTKSVVFAPFTWPSQNKVPVPEKILAQHTIFTKYMIQPSVTGLVRVLANGLLGI